MKGNVFKCTLYVQRILYNQMSVEVNNTTQAAEGQFVGQSRVGERFIQVLLIHVLI